MTDLLKAPDVATRLGISRRAAYYLISSGELPSVTIGKKSVRVRPDDLQAYIDAQRTEKRDEDAATS